MSTSNIPTTLVSQLSQLPDGSPVLRTEATIDYVGKRFTGTGARGDYSFQDIGITDQGAKFKATLVDRQEMPVSANGDRVTILCHKSDRGWTGVKIKERQNAEKTGVVNVLWITPTAEIISGGLTSGANIQPPTNARFAPPAAQPAAQPQQPTLPVQTPPAAQPTPQGNKAGFEEARLLAGKEAIQKTKQALARYANLYQLCVQTMEFMAGQIAERRASELDLEKSVASGVPMTMTLECQQSAVATLFIQATRDRIGEDLPCGKLSKYLEA